MTFGNIHRVWIQTCASRGCILHEEALRMFDPLWQKEYKRRPTEADLDELHDELNQKLRDMSQKISVETCAVTRKKYVVFADTSDAEIMKVQTNVTEVERKYFKSLLKELALSAAQFDEHAAGVPHGINLITAINLVDDRTGNNTTAGTQSASSRSTLKKERAEKLITMWTRQGYFVQLGDSLHFGPRGVAEFGRPLMTAFPEHVSACPLCMAAVFRVIRCADCAKSYHKTCLQKYLARNSKCPSCKRMWNVRLSQ